MAGKRISLQKSSSMIIMKPLSIIKTAGCKWKSSHLCIRAAVI
jgi:hypothetical protein